MPDRVIRDELLESEPFLSLKDNADRLAFISILLRCDTLGNMPAGPFRLLRLWRDWGISTEPLVAKTLAELCDHDLVRLYEHSGKRYLHVPRFGQRRRYIGRLFPLSPWTTDKEKQALAKLSPGDSPVHTGSAPAGVGVGVGVGVETKPIVRSTLSTTPPGFLKFWESWPVNPRKVNRKGAMDKWVRGKFEAVADKIIAHVADMKETEQWQEFCPMPVTYLNQRRWEDGVPTKAKVEYD